jgi:phage baseplate assembly protein W
MATIYLDNLFNPRQTQNPTTLPDRSPVNVMPIYTDLHLDLTNSKNIGLGLNPQNANDIEVDNDVNAIKNSLYNIFTTIPGQKVLSPSFGSNLSQYLFEAVDSTRGKIIGDNILRTINIFEPRVDILNIEVYPLPDQLMYHIILIYKLIGKASTFKTPIQIFPNNIQIL